MSIKLLNRVAAALAAALIASPCLAAEEKTDKKKKEAVMEEIIVTATYRDTRLMDTPLAISAVTSEDMVVKGIEDIQTLYQAIPGLSYQGVVEIGSGSRLSIRGITPQPGSVGAVGVYLDNLPITSVRTGGDTLGSLFDMERVEVLKGPQGTLYGEGSMGGNIRYITNKPDTSGLDYSVRSSVENGSKSDDLSYRIDAMVNIPLADQLALRLVGYRRDRAGVLDTPAPRNEKDVDTFEENGLRAWLKWDASETFEVTAMVNVVNSEMEGPMIAFHCHTEAFDANEADGDQVPRYLPGTTCARGKSDVFDHGDPYVTHLADPTFVNSGHDDQTSYNLSIDWELPFADLISSTSYFDREAMSGGQTAQYGVGLGYGLFGFIDGGCFGLLSVCGPNKVSAIAYSNAYGTSERIVQEFRLISNTDGPLQWTLGAYYKDDDSIEGIIAPCYKGGAPAYATGIDHCLFMFGFFPDVPLENQILIAQWLNAFIEGNVSYPGFKEQAIYGEASYRLSDQWEILLGLRLAEVEHVFDIGREGVNSKVDPIFHFAKPSDIVSPKVVLTWRPIEGWMIYATYSEGFRPGQINNQLVTKIALLEGAVNTGIGVLKSNLSDEARALAQSQIDRTSRFQTVESDFVENTELGIKASVLGGRLSFTGSLYRIAYEDYVLRIRDFFPKTGGLPGHPSLLYGINAGSAESKGLELEVRLALTDNLFLTFGGDKSFRAHLNSVAEGLDVTGVTPGTRMSNAPEYSYYASLAYDFDLFGMNATARADTYGVASSLDNSNLTLKYSKPAYRTTDLKLLVKLDKWMLSAYVRNVTDEKIVYEFRQQGYHLGQPRTFGVQVNYRM